MYSEVNLDDPERNKHQKMKMIFEKADQLGRQQTELVRIETAYNALGDGDTGYIPSALLGTEDSSTKLQER